LRNALVVLSPAKETAPHAVEAGRANADFIAQLIANATKAPQTCARRRATPDEATAVYRARDVAPARMGRVVSRSL
jgi:hypothetical protein